MRQRWKAFAAIAVSGALLAACAGTRNFLPSAKQCNGSCDVEVKVQTSFGVCYATVSSTDAELEVGKGQQAKITWRLSPQDGLNYQFKDENDPNPGIAFKPRTPITNADFDSPKRNGQDKFSWRSVNGRDGKRTFEYTVNLQRLQGHSGNPVDCLPLDPKITNDGS